MPRIRFRQYGWAFRIAALFAWSHSAAAQVRSFDLPAQEATRSIPEFARQAGIQIFVPTERLRGVQLPGIQGQHDVREALRTLLVGSGLEIVSDDGNTIVLRGPAPKPKPDLATGDADVRTRTARNTAARGPSAKPEIVQVEEIFVTGTRLTTGFEAPTPVTVISSQILTETMPSNVADALRQLPALGATLSGNQTGSGTGAAGSNGQSLINLRNLGTNRNLVLLDGRRIVASNVNNSVDINTLPQNLISRVDIVTGGASAAYGSDAVAGVVNFVLDTRFNGLKGEVGGGISDYGDLPNWKGSLAWGGSFAGDRLHVVASTQYFKQLGTEVNVPNGRSWWDRPYGLISNTTGSGPENLVLPNIRSSVGSNGGLITNTILKGTQFLANGQTAPFNYGYSAGSAWQSGGDGAWISFNLSPTQWRTANFLHAEYDIDDELLAYGELAYSYARVTDDNQKPINTGARFNYTIFSGNPYLPASIQAAMTANNITSFTMGRYMMDYPDVVILTGTRVMRQVLGFKGQLGDKWKWDVSYSNGETNQLLAQKNLTIARPTYAAADAVVSPLTGQIVCRSQYYDLQGNFVPQGTGMDPGCRPQNLFGTNTIDPTTIPYTIGDSWKRYKVRQQVVMVTLSGDLGEHIATEAGPISLATGAEYRHEHGNATTDPVSVTTIDFTGVRGGPPALQGQLGPFRFANFQPFHGEYNVTEGFAEVGIPLLKNRPLADYFNLDFAGRVTDYSTSGTVVTWKAGADYQIIPDVRLRGTVSRDIRAPSLLELYNSATQNSQNQFYPSTSNGTATPTVQITSGNPDLVPEKALTQTYGVVLTPMFAEGLQFSADYYNIEIDNAIQSVSPQQTIDNCYLGVPGFCNFVQFAAGTVRVRTPFLNFAVVKTAGFDFEASYKTQLFGNPLQLNLLASDLTEAATRVPAAAEISTLGGNNDPKWRVNLRATYDVGNWEFFLQERYISPKLVDTQRLEGVYVDDNTVDAAFYTDATITYALDAFGSKNQIYLTVNNLTNQNPPKDIGPPTSFSQPGNRNVYDWIGRYYSLGIRFRL